MAGEFLKYEEEQCKPFNDENIRRWNEEYERLSRLSFNRQKFLTLVTEAQSFLTLLRNHPKELVKDLCQNIITMIKDYDFNNPLRQNYLTRCTLRKLAAYSNFQEIQTMLERNNELNNDNSINESHRRTYLELCGLVYSVKAELENSENNEKLIQALAALCFKTHITAAGNLPDEMVVDTNCVVYYQAKHKDTLSFNSEAKELKDSLATLKNILNPQPADPTIKLPQEMFDLAEKIRHTICQQSKKMDDRFDHKFSVTVLKSTAALLQNPFCKDAQANYYHWANFAEGATADGLKLKAFMMGLLGIALCISAVMLVGIGLGMPVSSYLLNSGFYLLLATTSILTIGGSAALINAVGLFKQCKPTGLSKDMHEFAERTQAFCSNHIKPNII